MNKTWNRAKKSGKVKKKNIISQAWKISNHSYQCIGGSVDWDSHWQHGRGYWKMTVVKIDSICLPWIAWAGTMWGDPILAVEKYSLTGSQDFVDPDMAWLLARAVREQLSKKAVKMPNIISWAMSPVWIDYYSPGRVFAVLCWQYPSEKYLKLGDFPTCSPLRWHFCGCQPACDGFDTPRALSC